MAEQIVHDVVKEAQSMGGPAPIDNTATSTNSSAGSGEAPSAPQTTHPDPSETTFSNTTSAKDVPGDETQLPNGVGRRVEAVSIGVQKTPACAHWMQEPVTDLTDHKDSDSIPLVVKDKLVNGDSGEHSASEDVSSQQGLGEISAGSDTDISRPGSVDTTKERATGHLRSNSVKKPASFKSVSVTKNFLAKSAVSTPTARPGEKAAPAGLSNASTPPTAKPRLVAKSGSGIGNIPRSSLSKLNGAGTGPDASKVWNKNQPVPPPPPKQFTDEELKQQYGIHLATRLQADEAGKEAKWADIDDDEDDWAPETVQWMDGTKSSLANAAENQPPVQEEPKPSAAPEVVPLEVSKPQPTAPVASQRPSSTTGTKTILKPGAHAQTSAVKSGLVLKGQPEKPTLVAKPSAPTAVKSPWATLPPVDKVSPIQMNPPAQQAPPLRFSQRDHPGYDAMPPLPAKEIAPDDFNRSWRDDRGSRELFNSHSGRYEPVNDMRRGSFRDGGYRQQPSVLQRPSQDGPAEPSAAFQTSRTSADAPAWGRRRNSSNVSGGSGRRMSFDRRPDVPPLSPLGVQRRGSHSINGPDPLHLGPARQLQGQQTLPEQQPGWTQKPSPSLSNAQPVSPYGSVGSSGPHDIAAANAPAQTPSVPAEDPVEVQKRLMREKREAARLQKQREREQEEKEEAERKERLRKKLEALAAADAPKPKSKELSPSRPVEKSPQKEKVAPAPVQSPPKPPVPTSEGEVAQYGMMKVHQPQPVKKTIHADSAPKNLKGGDSAPKTSPSPVKTQGEEQVKVAHSLGDSQPPPPKSFIQDNNVNSKASSEQSQAQPPLPEGEARAAAGPILKPSHPPATGWTTNLAQQSQSRPWGSNVWGPPQAKDRALGNGTFESGYNRGQPRPSPPQLPSQSQTGQAPALGLNPSLKPSPPQPQSVTNPPFAQQTMYRSGEGAPAQQAVAAAKPGPIAPPTAAAKGWGNFHEAIRRDDQAMVVKAQQEFDRLGGETFRPEINETYTDQQGKAQKTLHVKVAGNPTLTKPDNQQTVATETKAKDDIPKIDNPATHANITQGSHAPPAGTAARSSRFFPRPSEAVAQAHTASSKSDSPPPPPPETESHPAFTGDMEHPRVKMPNPPPRVRLPPAATEAIVPVDAPVSMPSRIRLGIGARPLVNSLEWQARFNSLLDKSPPAPAPAPIAKPPTATQQAAYTKPGALAVAAASKAPLDVRTNVATATVSLPNAPPRKLFSDDRGREVITRCSAEEALLEDREFGSLPIVKPPKVPHLAAGEPPVGFPREVRPNSRLQRPLDVITKPFLHFADYDRNADHIDVRILLSGMHSAINVALAKKRDHRKGASVRTSKRNFTPNSNTSPGNNQNQRPRKPSNYQQGQNSNSTSSPRPTGGNGWNSNRSTPPHNNNNTNTTWARRAAPVH